MKNTTNIAHALLGALASRLPLWAQPFRPAAALLLLLILAPSAAFAGSATWQTSPGSGDWNTASNWMPATVPNGSSDTATFASSNTTNVSFSAVDTVVEGIVFNPGASSFTFTLAPPPGRGVNLEVDGLGITNNSGVAQNFMIVANGSIGFSGHATAGNGNFTNTGNGALGEGLTVFTDFSTAGNATFTNHGGVTSPSGMGETRFLGGSTADHATFTNNGAEGSEAPAGNTTFSDFSTADHATIINNGGTVSGAPGGNTSFFNPSTSSPPTAGNATLIANGGQNGGRGGSILFFTQSNGGAARVEVFGNGELDIGSHTAGGVTIGSLEGDGNVFLGAKNLTVGSNNLSTNFSGVIQDGGIGGGAGGSLTKIGIGKLVLSHRNTYTGGTTVNRGRLVVNTRGRSGTGSGPVQVNRGRLAGMGTIAGAVTVGTGSGLGAVLSPGYHHSTNPGTLTIQSPLTFNSDATYEIEVNSSTATADDAVAAGVSISSGAQASFADLGSAILPVSEVFTVINNTSANPIAGTFANLPDGSTFTSNGNRYRANYQGGDGNDLTLTVVR